MANDVNAKLAAFRASLLHETVLPVSKLEVTLKKVSLTDLLMSGNIPDTLSGLVQQLLKGGGKAVDTGKIFSSLDDMNSVLGMFNLITKLCVISPPVADEPDDDHLGIGELPFEDKQFIFEWANGGANALISFRQESGADDQSAHPG